VLSHTQQVLITTHSKNWGAYSVLSLGPFTPEESEAYFLKHVPSYELRQGSENLAKALEYLPFALSWAVGHMQAHAKTAKECLEFLLAQLTPHASSDEVVPAAVLASVAAAVVEPAPAYIPNFFPSVAAAQPQAAAAADPQIVQLKIKLVAAKEQRASVFTKMKDHEDYDPCDNKEDLSEHIAELKSDIKKATDKGKGKEAKKKEEELAYYQAIATEVDQLDAAIQAIEKELRKLTTGLQQAHAVINETIVEGEVGEVISNIANASNVPEALAEKMMQHQQEIAERGISNKTVVKHGAKVDKVSTGMLNFDFASPSTSC
jgi:hypothetical protein